MTKQEFAVIVAAMRTYYGKENLLPNTHAMDLWYAQLEDIPYKVAEAALNKWVSTNRFSPTIADLRQAAAEIVGAETADWGEAWEQVRQAVSRFGMYRKQDALDSMDPLTRQAVERVGWHEICMSENIGIERASFRDIYGAIAQRAQQTAKLPPGVRAMMDEIRQKQKLIEGA